MKDKVKSCFTPHIAIHSLFGLGLGIVLVNLLPSLNTIWIGLVAMLVAVVLDWLRKS